MKKIFIITIFAFLYLLITGCGEHIIVNGNSYRIMDAQEEKAMLEFARRTLIQSEKITTAEQNFILATRPSIKISYTGNKQGRASYEWICNDRIMFRLNCEGRFMSRDMKVNTRKINLREDVKKGQKSNLEKLTFKEIKP